STPAARADRGGAAVADAARARGDRASLRAAGRAAADAGGGGPDVRHHPRAHPPDRGARAAEAAAAVAEPAAGGVRGDGVTLGERPKRQRGTQPVPSLALRALLPPRWLSGVWLNAARPAGRRPSAASRPTRRTPSACPARRGRSSA